MPIFLALSGCAASNAVLNSVIAAGVAAARRAEGECFNPCTPGTQCNPETGLCEQIECGGECTDEEYCDTSGAVPRCVYVGKAGMKVRRGADDRTHPSPHEPEPGD